MKLVILGSGGYGHTVEDVALQLGYDQIIFLDDSLPGYLPNSFSSYISDDTVFITAFGNNKFRMEWIYKLQSAGVVLATLIHPSSYISPIIEI